MSFSPDEKFLSLGRRGVAKRRRGTNSETGEALDAKRINNRVVEGKARNLRLVSYHSPGVWRT